MGAAALPAPRRGLWRGDIARIAGLGAPAAYAAGEAFWLGWEAQAPAEALVEAPPLLLPTQPVPESTAPGAPPVEDPWPRVRHLVAEYVEDAPGDPPVLELGAGWSAADLRCGDEALRQRPTPAPLVPWSELEAPLRRAVADLRPSARPDVPDAVGRLARGELLDRLRRERRQTWPRRLCLVFDRSERLLTLGDDVRALAADLVRVCGPAAVFEPAGPPLADAVARAGWRGEAIGLVCDAVRADDVVLVISDLGGGDPAASRAWERTFAAIADKGARALALLPLGRRRWPRWLRDKLALAWGADASGLDDPAVERDAARLAALLAIAVFREPALLRAARLALGGRRAGVEVELAAVARLRAAAGAWGMDPGEGAGLDAARRACRAREAAAFAAALREVHGDLPPELRLLEDVRWRRAMGSELWSRDAVKGWCEQLLATGRVVGADAALVAEVGKVGRWIADDASSMTYDDEVIGVPLQRLVAWAVAKRPGAPMPAGVAAAAAADVADGSACRRWRLVHLPGQLWLVPADGAGLAAPQGFVEICKVAGDALAWSVSAPGRAGRLMALETDWGGLAALPESERVEVEIGRARVRLRWLEKEPWFSGMWRDRRGLRATLRRGPYDVPYQVTWGPEEVVFDESGYYDATPVPLVDGWWGFLATPAWASEAGVDGFGLWADWTVEGVVHRFRWIPPGRFMMGSGDDDPEAEAIEKPAHEVTLTHGYWLGEAPVTQSLWSALMRMNPSEFKGASHPVGRVSRDDAKEFCRRANGYMPGLDLRLPWEAEWEYACRGPRAEGQAAAARYGMLEEVAWHDGNSNGTSHPVKEKKPNGFGLYDTFGNVWEWCQDWFGDFGADALVDPDGPDAGHKGVLRGGSWRYDVGYARAAHRFAYLPDFRWMDFGFRLARGGQGPANDAANLQRPVPEWSKPASSAAARIQPEDRVSEYALKKEIKPF